MAKIVKLVILETAEDPEAGKPVSAHPTSTALVTIQEDVDLVLTALGMVMVPLASKYMHEGNMQAALNTVESLHETLGWDLSGEDGKAAADMQYLADKAAAAAKAMRETDEAISDMLAADTAALVAEAEAIVSRVKTDETDA